MSTTATEEQVTPSTTTSAPAPAATHQRYVSPEVNIFETAEGYLVEAELPGVSKNGVELGVEANTLTITGHRAKVDLAAQPLYRESSAADYRRVFELDPAIDTEKIDARLEQGVLTIRLPKSDRAKPRKVQVNG
jgi:HSP20 family protein